MLVQLVYKNIDGILKVFCDICDKDEMFHKKNHSRATEDFEDEVETLKDIY